MVDSELIQLAEQELAVLCGEFPMKKTPRIVWRKYRTTAGMASYVKQEIMLSSIVLNEAPKLISTLRHEYAHLLAFDRVGSKGRGHGIAWQTAMRDLGLEPKVTHRYEVKRNIPRQVVIYQCVKCKFTFERKRRLTTNKRFIHRDCGGNVKIINIEVAMINVRES